MPERTVERLANTRILGALRSALWHWRCPALAEFAGDLPPILDRAVTEHYFDPCELLAENARSELRAEHRQRQAGGGWEYAKPGSRCGVPKG
jgi:hypothetical protein